MTLKELIIFYQRQEKESMIELDNGLIKDTLSYLKQLEQISEPRAY